ncbi:Fe2OG dioxygenase domain-containing protein [Mycena indigotica]|uniref:Fe2OG dioxygenase domain-containing protein n=1 Tax=Mycena indigotica TaxID=2126181 RepID=A0A8H6VUJ4_9AGAR|nr:Fe2OG dioxygenase domain-containing protein [Mycena indigotica]KAF7288759.1 Fe2OG dioxygenase domain-containing protein [Mycena indigotica]
MAEAHLSALRDAMKQSTPWTCGVLDVRREDLALFYKHAGTERWAFLAMLNFGEATEAQLQDLAAACQPATFGRGTEDVLDEGYRKAGKLDCGDFAASLDIGTLNILEEITPDLLDGRGDAVITAELYKLNVYSEFNPRKVLPFIECPPGPGSFFKSHKDTPRRKSMVGSLVIVLPTEHRGGQLNLSHGKNSFTFDSAVRLSGQGGSIAYVAFFSDVTHAVEPVVSGHRVTLTYNLLISPKSSSLHLNTKQPLSEVEVACQSALAALLADPAFLPDGGLLGFGLEHEYPVPRTISDPTTLGHVLYMLKGADARMQRAAARAGLKTTLKLVYITPGDMDYDSGKGVRMALDSVLDLRRVWLAEDSEVDDELRRVGQPIVRTTAAGRQAWTKLYDDEQLVSVCWVTEPQGERNRAESAYIAMGNEPVLDHVYGRAVLLVEIPRAEHPQRA